MVLFCDADVEMKPTMIEELEKYLEQNSEIAYAYCRFKWMNRSFACGEFDVSRIRKENYICSLLLENRHVYRVLLF